MASGIYKHLVSVQYPEETVSSLGDIVTIWTELCEDYAAIEPFAGREFFEAQQVVANITTRIRMRVINQVVPKWRIVFGNHIYDIQSVLNFSMENNVMHLMCREILGQ
jgi:SPP1 family predicted phage head-tail adaptor